MTEEMADDSESAALRLACEIRRQRKDSGLSQAQLAQRVGYTRQYVSLAERPGKNLPSGELVDALDRVFGASGSLRALRDEAKREQLSTRATSEPSHADRFGEDVVGDDLPRLRRALASCDVRSSPRRPGFSPWPIALPTAWRSSSASSTCRRGSSTSCA